MMEKKMKITIFVLGLRLCRYLFFLPLYKDGIGILVRDTSNLFPEISQTLAAKSLSA